MIAAKSLRLLLPAAAVFLAASASAVSAEAPTYEARLREWTSAGYRIQAGAVYLSSLQRTDSVYPHFNAEVAGVQVGAGAALTPEPPSYAEQLRRFTPEGYRIQPGFVNTSAIARR